MSNVGVDRSVARSGVAPTADVAAGRGLYLQGMAKSPRITRYSATALRTERYCAFDIVGFHHVACPAVSRSLLGGVV